MAAVTVKRKNRESSDQLLVRFNRKSTRFVKQTRNSRFLGKSTSPLKKRKAAVIREQHRLENEKRKNYE